MKTMVIGLGPDYNYSINDHDAWDKDNTKYASNHGASLIARTIQKYFDAVFISDFSNPEKYRKEYDLCVIAFATHITSWRDVSIYTNFIKKLGIKTVAFSLGIQDYAGSTTNVHSLHFSIKELLEHVIQSSGYVGVRGPHTAALLLKNGFKQSTVRQIGCPTVFNPVNRDLKISKHADELNPIIVFHRTMADLNERLIGGAPLLGQDYLDEVIFKDEVSEDQPMRKIEMRRFKNHKNGLFTLNQIKSNGVFHNTFDEWFDEIKSHNFVLGARLHGCIGALIQNVPAVMIARDIRVQEIAEFYGIPYLKYSDVKNLSIKEIYEGADYSRFNSIYKVRFDNFVKLLSDTGIIERSLFSKFDVPQEVVYLESDLNIFNEILFQEIRGLAENSETQMKSLNDRLKQMNGRIDYVVNKINKIPGANIVKKLFK